MFIKVTSDDSDTYINPNLISRMVVGEDRESNFPFKIMVEYMGDMDTREYYSYKNKQERDKVVEKLLRGHNYVFNSIQF